MRSIINETMGQARTPAAQQVMQLYNDVQLCREMGWTQDELDQADDDFVWICLQVLGLEGEKQKSDAKRNNRGGSAEATIHHQVG